LPETDSTGAVELAERICREVSKASLIFNDEMITVTISLGVAQLSDAGTSYEELIGQADSALYQAKAQGRNQVCCATHS